MEAANAVPPRLFGQGPASFFRHAGPRVICAAD